MDNLDDSEELYRRMHDEKWLLQAIQKAVREALMDHKRAGNPVAVWRDGQVVIVPPEEIPDFEAAPPEETKAA